jgi:transposase
VAQLRQLQAQIKAIEVELLAWHRATDASRRLETIPGVGFITATAMVSARSRRWATDMCAPSSSSAQPRSCDTPGARTPQWVNALLARRLARLVSVALANKTARIIWAVLVRGETYRTPASAAV